MSYKYESGAKTGADGFYTPMDERPIQGSENYDLNDISEVHLVENYQEIQQAQNDDLMLNNIVNAYKQMLEEKDFQSQKVLKDEVEIVSKNKDRKKAE